jgi:hypothetical protein
MSKKLEIYMDSKAMQQYEEEQYAQYKAAARLLLIKHKAEDLLPMLGLEEETHEHDPS